MAGSEVKRHLGRSALIWLALSLALAACSGSKLYAPEGSIQERLHKLDLMCRSYLFESGSFTLSEDFADYAPQIARFCANEAHRMGRICDNPGEEFNHQDVRVLENAADALGEMSLAIEDTLATVDPADPQSRKADAPKMEYAALHQIASYIDEQHRRLGGSDALYK